MTPSEMDAAARGWAQAERVRFITIARAFGSKITDQQAQRIVQGRAARGGALPHAEQERKLAEMQARHGWGHGATR